MAAKYTLDSILPGPPQKFSYTEIATGEQIVRNGKFPDEEVVGTEPATGGDEAIAHGHTTFVDPVDGGGGKSLYGETAIGSRTFKPGGDEPDINLGEGVRSLYNKWSIHNYNNRAGGVSGAQDAYKSYNKAVTEGSEAELLNPTARRWSNLK